MQKQNQILPVVMSILQCYNEFYNDCLLCVDDQDRELPSILNKLPEFEDVYKFLRNKSAHWDDFATDMLIDYNFRQQLSHDGSLTANRKLEEVILKWIESKSSDVTWSNLFEVLEQLEFLDIASKVKTYLERKEVIEKYHQKKDYTGQLLCWWYIRIMLVYYQYAIRIMLVWY